MDKILKGAKPDLPVEQPTKFELVYLKTAKASASRSRLRCSRGRMKCRGTPNWMQALEL